MASQSANPGGSGNQDGAIHSLVSSVRGEADRDDSARVFGSHVILDDRRSRKQAAGVPGLLQWSSYPSVTGGTNTRSGRDGASTCCRSPLLSMAIPLSRSVSDSDRCMIIRKILVSAVRRELGKAIRRAGPFPV